MMPCVCIYAISAKEILKNPTDKERFVARCLASRRRANNGVLVPVRYQPPRSRSRRVLDLKVLSTLTGDTRRTTSELPARRG